MKECARKKVLEDGRTVYGYIKTSDSWSTQESYFEKKSDYLLAPIRINLFSPLGLFTALVIGFILGLKLAK